MLIPVRLSDSTELILYEVHLLAIKMSLIMAESGHKTTQSAVETGSACSDLMT